jgi:hypothetical protein
LDGLQGNDVHSTFHENQSTAAKKSVCTHTWCTCTTHTWTHIEREHDDHINIFLSFRKWSVKFLVIVGHESQSLESSQIKTVVFFSFTLNVLQVQWTYVHRFGNHNIANIYMTSLRICGMGLSGCKKKFYLDSSSVLFKNRQISIQGKSNAYNCSSHYNFIKFYCMTDT